jgi:putative acetyltransferase
MRDYAPPDSSHIEIRPEQPADAASVRQVNELAFGQALEADLVDELRRDGAVVVSLVAVADGLVVGHVLFSALEVSRSATSFRAVALAPLAVQPERRRQGIGSLLVRRGIQECKRAAIDAIIVLGYPEYYAQFGFSAERSANLKAPYSGPAFMALELTPGVLDAGDVVVRYADAFSRVT